MPGDPESLAASDGFGQGYVGEGPDGDVDAEEEGDADQAAQQVVCQCQEQARSHYRGHGYARPHA